jgi:hypothetical protein
VLDQVSLGAVDAAPLVSALLEVVASAAVDAAPLASVLLEVVVPAYTGIHLLALAGSGIHLLELAGVAGIDWGMAVLLWMVGMLVWLLEPVGMPRMSNIVGGEDGDRSLFLGTMLTPVTLVNSET